MVSHYLESRSRVHIRMTLIRCYSSEFSGNCFPLCGLNCQEGSEMTIECGRMTASRESMKKRSYWKETIPEKQKKSDPTLPANISCTLTGTDCTLYVYALSLLAQVVLMAKNLPVNVRDKRDSRPTWIESALVFALWVGKIP